MKKTNKKNSYSKLPTVLTISGRPVYYHTGIFQEMELSAVYDSTVCYLDTVGLSNHYDKFLKCWVKYDIPLLDGHKSFFLKNFGWDRSDSRFFSRINPSVFYKVRKYDVIFFIAFSTFSHWLAFFGAIIFRKKIVWRGEATLVAESKLGFAWKIKKKLVSFFLNRCDALMYSCSGNREYIDYFNSSVKKFPILCAVDNGFYQAKRKKYFPNRNKIREEYGIRKNEVVIIFPSKLIDRKDPLTLVKAMSSIIGAKDLPPVKLLFVGDGELREQLEIECKENNIPVIFTGFLAPGIIPKFYAISDIYVILSQIDHSPKAVNEAMNFSLPIIATNVIGTANEVVEENGNGYLIDVGDSQLLGQYLRELIIDKQKRKKMGVASLKLVGNYTFKKNVESIDEMISYVLQE